MTFSIGFHAGLTGQPRTDEARLDRGQRTFDPDHGAVPGDGRGSDRPALKPVDSNSDRRPPGHAREQIGPGVGAEAGAHLSGLRVDLGLHLGLGQETRAGSIRGLPAGNGGFGREHLAAAHQGAAGLTKHNDTHFGKGPEPSIDGSREPQQPIGGNVGQARAAIDRAGMGFVPADASGREVRQIGTRGDLDTRGAERRTAVEAGARPGTPGPAGPGDRLVPHDGVEPAALAPAKAEPSARIPGETGHLRRATGRNAAVAETVDARVATPIAGTNAGSLSILPGAAGTHFVRPPTTNLTGGLASSAGQPALVPPAAETPISAAPSGSIEATVYGMPRDSGVPRVAETNAAVAQRDFTADARSPAAADSRSADSPNSTGAPIAARPAVDTVGTGTNADLPAAGAERTALAASAFSAEPNLMAASTPLAAIAPTDAAARRSDGDRLQAEAGAALRAEVMGILASGAREAGRDIASVTPAAIRLDGTPSLMARIDPSSTAADTSLGGAGAVAASGAPGVGGMPLTLFNAFLARRVTRGRSRRRGQRSVGESGLWAILRVLGWQRRRRTAGADQSAEGDNPTPSLYRKIVTLIGRGRARRPKAAGEKPMSRRQRRVLGANDEGVDA